VQMIDRCGKGHEAILDCRGVGRGRAGGRGHTPGVKTPYIFRARARAKENLRLKPQATSLGLLGCRGKSKCQGESRLLRWAMEWETKGALWNGKQKGGRA
jgi:hypothetical protein